MKKSCGFATFYRVLGTFFILMCHFTAQSNSVYLNMSAQFFNIGVEMFFILSGFLSGISNGQYQNAKSWYKRRVRRIYIPYELFIILLLTVHLIYRKNVITLDWLWLLLGIQGSVVGVLGAEQTWFITSILLCYLITPLLDFIYLRMQENISHLRLLAYLLVFIPAGLSFIPPAFVSTVFSPLCWYTLSFLFGRKFEQISIKRKYIIPAFLITLLAFGCRILVRHYFDGTIFYDRVIVSYTQVIAAFSLFYLTAFFTRNMIPGKLLSFISSISFEIYLYHYMFCVGPIYLFSVTDSWCINCFIIAALTTCVAAFMNKISRRISEKVLP